MSRRVSLKSAAADSRWGAGRGTGDKGAGGRNCGIVEGGKGQEAASEG